MPHFGPTYLITCPGQPFAVNQHGFDFFIYPSNTAQP